MTISNNIFWNLVPAICAIVVASWLTGFAKPASAASVTDDCHQSQNNHLRFNSCTLLIEDKNSSAPMRSWAYNNRGIAWKEGGQTARAEIDFSEAVRLDPTNADAYFNRGGLSIDQQEWARAIADYDNAIRYRPNWPGAFRLRGEAWMNKSDLSRAVNDFDEAIRLDANMAEAYNGRANVWWKRGDGDRALADIDQAIRLKPKNSLFYVTRATALYEKGDKKRAVAAYDEAVRLNPSNAVVFNNRAFVLIDLGELDRAMADLNESIHLNPNYSKAYANRGLVWRLKGDLDRALIDQDQAVRLKPDEALGYNSRGDTLRYEGQYARALADYDVASRFGQGDIPSFTGRGLTYEKMGDFARAQVEFQKAVDSTTSFRANVNRQALETARAQLAALRSGAVQPIIPAAPSKVTAATSVPTAAATIPAFTGDALKRGRRIALVIGNSNYDNAPALDNPQNDARAVAASLRAVGFEITLASDQSRRQIIDALGTFAVQAKNSDWAVVYYSGHGMEVSGMNYIIPVEAKLATDRDVLSEAVPLDLVLAAAHGARKLSLILVDACRNNPFTSRMIQSAPTLVVNQQRSAVVSASATRSIGRGMAEVKVSGATLVVFAAKDGQTALDGEGDNSPFAIALTQRIATPNVEINKLFRLVRDDVMEATAGRQEPFTYGSLPGNEDFFFVAK